MFQHLAEEKEEYKQCLEISRHEVKNSNDIILELQDEISVLRNRLNELENQPHDVNTRGNSLFAEVYDR